MRGVAGLEASLGLRVPNPSCLTLENAPVARATQNPTAGCAPRVRAEVQRIADAAARRLLAEQLDRDPLGTPTGTDGGALDGGANQSPSLLKR
jgi:hypothetical protein